MKKKPVELTFAKYLRYIIHVTRLDKLFKLTIYGIIIYYIFCFVTGYPNWEEARSSFRYPKNYYIVCSPTINKYLPDNPIRDNHITDLISIGPDTFKDSNATWYDMIIDPNYPKMWQISKNFDGEEYYYYIIKSHSEENIRIKKTKAVTSTRKPRNYHAIQQYKKGK